LFPLGQKKSAPMSCAPQAVRHLFELNESAKTNNNNAKKQ
jgi:hypothetical protein